MGPSPGMLKKNPLEKQQIPIHWVMFINVFIIAGIMVVGVFVISREIRITLDKSGQNLKETALAAQNTDKLVSQQLPLRKLVMTQQILVERFTHEFDLFVAKEEPNIVQLKNALEQMLENYKRLEQNWNRDIPETYLLSLKENTYMIIGIFEEAAEFETVGFGEIYRLAEESKTAVSALTQAMDRLEDLLDKILLGAADQVNQSILSTAINARSLSHSLERIYHKNQVILWAILLTLILFQAAIPDRLPPDEGGLGRT